MTTHHQSRSPADPTLRADSSLPANPTRPAIYPASAGWHGLMLAGAVAWPGQWPVWAAGIAANHLLLSGASIMPRSTLLGPNLSRLPAIATARGEIALTFDDGPDPDVTPQVLELLADAGASASFFCIGERVLAYPELARRIVAAGHTLENHTQTHSHRFAFRGAAGLRDEIARAQTSIETTAGTRPLFFRAPAGMRNPLLQPVLARLGLRLTSWTRRGFDTVARDPKRVFERLEKGLAAGDILLLHDGHARRDGAGQPAMLEILTRLLARMKALDLRSVSLVKGFDRVPSR